MNHLQARTRTGDRVTLKEREVGQLQGRLRGELIQPDGALYDEARKVHNAMHDCRPALIVRAANVADVIATVRFAGEHDLVLAMRGGGHSVPGYGTCDEGLVLDLGSLRGIRVDPQRRTVRADGGCTWGDLDHATHAFGLATTGGIVSTTGIAGLTLGGGMGQLSRRCGLACDNLLSADVVTADAQFLTCSEQQNTDLFWALRGGGGNFGVVTSFEFQLHAVGEILGGPIFFPIDRAVLQGYREWIRSAPEELGAIFGITLAPPLPFLSEKWHGQPVAAVIACWTGSAEEGERVLKPLAEWAPVVGSHVGPMPYPAINTLFDELLPPGLQQYWKGNFVRTLTDEAVEVHVEHGARVPCAESSMILFPLDGACQQVPDDATAFAYRDAMFSTVIAGAWPDPADNEHNIQWVREYAEALRPHSEEGGYVNFMDHDDQDRVRTNYRQNHDRLVQIKSRYDPANRFQRNQNIQPHPGGGRSTPA